MGISLKNFGLLALAVLLPSPFLFPSFTFHCIILADFFLSPRFVAFDSPIVQSYHKFLYERLPDTPELTPVTLNGADVTKESLRIASNDYTVPVVIRGML